jgi:NAD(P)-dependent dehydrogenase (short-subunit alcohol dehydrogenase family)
MTVLHILVNNSGATWGEALDKYPDEAWTKLLTLNVQRVFTLTQKLVPMLEKGSKRDGVGRVINVSPLSHCLAAGAERQIGSINGLSVPGLETYAYSASKAALHQ